VYSFIKKPPGGLRQRSLYLFTPAVPVFAAQTVGIPAEGQDKTILITRKLLKRSINCTRWRESSQTDARAVGQQNEYQRQSESGQCIRGLTSLHEHTYASIKSTGTSNCRSAHNSSGLHGSLRTIMIRVVNWIRRLRETAYHATARERALAITMLPSLV
jgi:hypothetical protein